MKFQTLKKDNRKYWLMGIGVVLIMVAVLCFVGTRAKYRNTQSIQVAKGTINYTTYDFNIVAMYDQNGNELTIMPDARSYAIDTSKSYCNVNNAKDSNAILKTTNGTHVIDNLQKKSKCYLYFTKISINNITDLINSYTIDASRSNGSFTSTYTEDTSGKIFVGADDYGTTYFFAGSNPDNWVQFGGFYWRIIRINGDGTIRLIYNGTTTDQKGETTQIGTSAFNENYNDNAYVGYMYGTAGSDNYNDTHANINDSTIKGVLDSWYESNLTSYSTYLDGNAGWCGDRSINTGSETWWTSDTKLGYGTNATAYIGFSRYITSSGNYNTVSQTASFKCSQTNDLYTISGSSNGNKALINPIGLITGDEVIYAGEFGGTESVGSWLRSNSTYWTMSPVQASYLGAFVSRVHMKGGLFGQYSVDKIYGVRPVINIKKDIQLTGSGTNSDPYKVVGAS